MSWFRILRTSRGSSGNGGGTQRAGSVNSHLLLSSPCDSPFDTRGELSALVAKIARERFRCVEQFQQGLAYDPVGSQHAIDLFTELSNGLELLSSRFRRTGDGENLHVLSKPRDLSQLGLNFRLQACRIDLQQLTVELHF